MKDEGSYILNSNLLYLLSHAIKHREELEKLWGYQLESAYLAGIKSNLKYLEENGTLEVK